MSASDAEGLGRHLVRFWSGFPRDRYRGWRYPGMATSFELELLGSSKGHHNAFNSMD